MALDILEFFGYTPLDPSSEASDARSSETCPFLGGRCSKKVDKVISGACTVKPKTSEAVVCCPQRMYAEKYRVLRDVAQIAFGDGVQLVKAQDVANLEHDGYQVAVFGKRWGKELRLPQRKGRGAYFVDWILALIDKRGMLAEFVAVEVQTIDTTGNYRDVVRAYRRGAEYHGSNSGGMNWENVSKRILPQIIYKGHVLRREPLCKKGLFFVCPQAVYERIRNRLGGDLLEYSHQPGAERASDQGGITGRICASCLMGAKKFPREG